MKKKKYLPLYKHWVQNGMPWFGLCGSLLMHNGWVPDGGLYLFRPFADPFHPKNQYYWGGERDQFTPLRQNILLFMAAMNGEL